ncbi:hypothetical protein [Nannocystis pusilla]|uniref:hypothetical protein n=1 Tax=Nannocystis pusilla TaxID=889268 RepID=UPI003DA401DD
MQPVHELEEPAPAQPVHEPEAAPGEAPQPVQQVREPETASGEAPQPVQQVREPETASGDLPPRERRTPEPEPEPEPEPFRGFPGLRGYVHLAPGLLALSTAPPRGPFYMWGVGAGGLWRGRKYLVVGAGGFFEHLTRADRDVLDPIVSWWTVDTRRHSLRLGAELRLGGAGRRVFAYGLLRAGAEVLVTNVRETAGIPAQTSTRNKTAAGFLGGIGMGVQGLVGRWLLLGFEPTFDLGLIDGDTYPRLRLRAFLGVAF